MVANAGWAQDFFVARYEKSYLVHNEPAGTFLSPDVRSEPVTHLTGSSIPQNEMYLKGGKRIKYLSQ